MYKKENIELPKMKSLLEGKEELIRKFKIFNDIYAFNAIYLTTNYDDYLDQIAIQHKLKPMIVSEADSSKPELDRNNEKVKIVYMTNQLLISNLKNGYVIHIHGSINDESNIIMTIVDYIKHYDHGTKPAILLEEIFKTHTVLFVGYGLEEYEILEFIVSKSKVTKNELKHFMLYPIFRKEINLLNFQKRYYAELGIQLIPYPIDEEGYEHLVKVINEWSKKIGPISRPKYFLEKIKLIDEVVK